MSTLRLRLNKARELLEAKDKELNESTKKTERLEKTCKILQRQMAQLRGNYAKQSHELAAEIQAARTRNLRRKGAIGILPTLDKNTPREPQEPSLAEETDTEKQRAVRERSKCVSWADATVPGTTHQASASKNPREMELIEEGTACFGPCRLFKNSLGDWTKITTTACGCDFFEYSNTDVRWLCCDRSIQVYYYGVVGATVISLANGRTIRYFNDGQIEIYRLSGEISRFDSVTSQRCETMLDENGSRYVEIFDCAGYCLRMWDGGHSSERFNERSSPRGHPEDRYVYNHSNVEPEWVEPDFCARRCPDGSLKIKFSHVMVGSLKISV
ncbi:hypothetical protein OESDEN_15777 [Oesophagostomum dentatum]|uniref:Uncharacterized protein n=1 Tax=Oesophagostomum dentatum TaxID=61180 RepID=A0A0B1SLV4_OESDE|nr:hypothetical protein OESDEN_15777 [Oesophagostomum dentatum]